MEGVGRETEDILIREVRIMSEVLTAITILALIIGGFIWIVISEVNK